uniref:UDP-glucuronosyltransferase n=2 Tax=Panagrolaimus davidi TaxID=227884 RepID=A0A914PG53_9BILA
MPFNHHYFFPVDIEEIIKSSKNGIVLFSFGSQVDISVIPEDLKLNIFNAFSKFPEIEFLIKYTQNQSETYDIVNNYRNIHPFDWMDQTSILSHPKLLAFITHGGRNSLAEAISAGVPTISIPLFADQHYNSAIFNYRKIGIAMELQELSEDKIVKALKTVINDKE